jgi:hypothetical protein
MSASPPFSQPRQKLRRAASHIKTLEGAIADYFKTDWYTCDFNRSPEGQYSLKVAVHGSPQDFGVIVGDAVHNLRAALDLLAVEAVDQNGGNTKNVYFPFADSAANLDEMIKRRNFHRASLDDQDTIRQLQPYTGGNHLLHSLHDLDIQDKHHSLIPHASFVTTPKIGVKLDAAGNPIGFAEGKLELEVDPSEPPTVKFTFPDDSVFAGEEVVAVLWQLHAHVTSIVDRFAGAVSEA